MDLGLNNIYLYKPDNSSYTLKTKRFKAFHNNFTILIFSAEKVKKIFGAALQAFISNFLPLLFRTFLTHDWRRARTHELICLDYIHKTYPVFLFQRPFLIHEQII